MVNLTASGMHNVTHDLIWMVKLCLIQSTKCAHVIVFMLFLPKKYFKSKADSHGKTGMQQSWNPLYGLQSDRNPGDKW